jgi:hypothetical protein
MLTLSFNIGMHGKLDHLGKIFIALFLLILNGVITLSSQKPAVSFCVDIFASKYIIKTQESII